MKNLLPKLLTCLACSMLFLLGLTSTAASQTGEALDFDGTDDYVVAPPITGLLGASQATVEFWANPDATGGYTHFVNYGANVFRVQYSNNANVNTYFGFAQIATTGAGGQLSTGVWQHVAVVFDGTQPQADRLKIYIDGVSQNLSGTIPAANTTLQSVASVNQTWLGSHEGRALFNDTRLDEVRIWNVARTATEINDSKNCELTGSESGLLAYYNFNQGVAGGNNAGVTTLNDLTSNNHDGTLQNFALNGGSSNWVTAGNPVSGACSTPSTVLVCDSLKDFPNAQGPAVIVGSTATCPSNMPNLTGGLCQNSGGVNWVVHGNHSSGGTRSYTCAWASLKANSDAAQYNACAICSN